MRICRAERRWSQQKLADQVGCARNTIARIENGSQPTLRTALGIAQALGVDVELLLTEEANEQQVGPES